MFLRMLCLRFFSHKGVIMPPRRVNKPKASPLDIQKFESIFKEYAPNENIEIAPKSWVLPNRVKFSKWIQENFKYNKAQPKSDLFPSQRFVKDFLQYPSPYRGILLFHGLGLGKTFASIITAENLISHMKVVVMLPASLKANYIEEVKNNKGGNSFFSVHQNWKFVPETSIAEIVQLVKDKLFVDKDVIKKNKGVWIPIKDQASNWSSLSDEEKIAVNRQIDNMIETKYQFINYNGITGKKLDEFEEQAAPNNPFDDKVVIVDEVHNLISRSVGNGQLGKRIYELILNAKNAKLILLSGTPMINYPYELAFIINLLRGQQEIHQLSFNPDSFDQKKITNELDQNPFIDVYEIDSINKTVMLQLLPDGFRFADKANFLVERSPNTTTAQEIIANLSQTILVKKHSDKKILLLPVKREEFNARFLDFQTDALKDPRLLSRRMAGCISYFGTYFGDVYPETLPTKVHVLNMSDHQFNKYEQKRFEEIGREEKAKRNSKRKQANDGDIFKSSGQIYRAYTRAICNFVFPEEITRPYPKKLSLLEKEIDVIEGDEVVGKEDQADADEKNVYNNTIQEALNKLKANGSAYLVGEGLSHLSPKYNAIMSRLQKSPGKSLVYSQFRTVEGLGVLSLVLEANGWAQFKVKKTSSGSWELDVPEAELESWIKKPKYFQYKGGLDETKLLMKIFNNDLVDIPDNIKNHIASNNLRGDVIKLIMITQSGAEGISLKHVREVHIMEPYWNEIRIEQVIGRAVRANSHVELDKEERNVRVFRYLVKLSPKQLKESKTIQNKDDGKSTDEYIHNVSQRKAKIINEMQGLMKNASVDCLVHSRHHDASVKCLAFPKNIDPNGLSYLLDFDKEEPDFEYKQKTRSKVVKKQGFRNCSINGIHYAFDTKNEILYDLDAYHSGYLEKVGKLKKDPSTGYYKFVKL